MKFSRNAMMFIPFVSVCLITSEAQNMHLLKTTELPEAFALEVDPLGNYYLVTPTSLFKYNLSDTLFSIYSELRLGPITTLDVSNPMKLTLFYETFSQIIFLDNTLNPTFTPTNLYDLDLQNATAVCSSFDNGFWVFNQPDFSLVRFNSFGEQDRRVKNLNLITGTELMPKRLLEKENRLYVYDPSAGIFLFDIFGGYLTRLRLKGFESFSVFDRKIYYSLSDSLFVWDTRTMKEKSMPLPETNVQCVRFEKNRLYILTKNGKLSVYMLKT